MKTQYSSFITACFAFTLLAGCSTTQTPQSAHHEVVGELTSLEHQWNRALTSGDAGTLETIYAQDHVMVIAGGKVVGRDHDLQKVRNGTLTFRKVEQREIDVRDHGHFAVVYVRNEAEGSDEGKPFVENTRFTDVFVRRGGRWQCVSSSATPVTP